MGKFLGSCSRRCFYGRGMFPGKDNLEVSTAALTFLIDTEITVAPMAHMPATLITDMGLYRVTTIMDTFVTEIMTCTTGDMIIGGTEDTAIWTMPQGDMGTLGRITVA